MIGRIATAVLALAYPVAVFLAVSFWNIGGLGWLILALGVARLLLGLKNRSDPAGWLAGVLLALVGAAILLTRAELSARLYPVVVNLALLIWFGWSLASPPTVIERLARLTEPELPYHAVAYTRRVTWIWCAFFLANGAAALYTALAASLEVWTLYNGFVAYLLMGTLFGLEYLVRRKVRRQHEA